MWKADPGDIGIDTRSMYISSPQAEQLLFVYFTFFTQCDCRNVKQILFHSKDVMGLLIYHQEYQLHTSQQVSFLLQLVVGFVKIELDWLDYSPNDTWFIAWQLWAEYNWRHVLESPVPKSYHMDVTHTNVVCSTLLKCWIIFNSKIMLKYLWTFRIMIYKCCV